MHENMNGSGERIWDNIFLVGGSDISHSADCFVYLIDAGDELILIDSGAGPGISKVIENMGVLGFSPKQISLVVSTHAHIDHIGGNAYLQRKYGCEIFAHELDAPGIETGEMVGSEFYGIPYEPCTVTKKMTGSEMDLRAGELTLHAIHIPGHTPGSIAFYTDVGGKRVLFGQDVHGPYVAHWGAVMDKVGLSLRRMKHLKADILCEGHFGIFSPQKAVADYIEQFLSRFV